MQELQQGLDLFKEGNYTQAIIIYDQIIQQQPENSEVHFNKAVALNKLDRYNEALESYGRAIQYRSHYPEAYLNQAIILVTLENNEQAIESLNKALELKPDLAEAHYHKATALAHLNQYDHALGSVNEALKLKENFPEAIQQKIILLEVLRNSNANQLQDAQQQLINLQQTVTQSQTASQELVQLQTQTTVKNQTLRNITTELTKLNEALQQMVVTKQKFDEQNQTLILGKKSLNDSIAISTKQVTELKQQLIELSSKVKAKEHTIKEDTDALASIKQSEVELQSKRQEHDQKTDDFRKAIANLYSKLQISADTVSEEPIANTDKPIEQAEILPKTVTNITNYNVEKVTNLLRAELSEPKFEKTVIELTEKLSPEKISSILAVLNTQLDHIIIMAVKTNDSLWHGLVIKDVLSPSSKHILKIIYSNPIGQAFDNNDHIKSLIRKIRDAYEISQFVDLKYKQEEQIEHSGAIVVENLVKIAMANFENLNQESLKDKLEKIGTIQTIKVKHSLIEETSEHYSKDKVETLLKILLKDSDVGIMPAVDFEDSAQLFKVIPDAVSNAMNNKHPVVIPLLITQQNWFGLLIKSQNDQKAIQVIYVNPQGKPLCNEQNYEILSKIIAEQSPSVHIIDLQLQQHYTNNQDGPRTVENLIILATKATNTSNYPDLQNMLKTSSLSISEVRQKHIDHLHKDNIPVPKNYEAVDNSGSSQQELADNIIEMPIAVDLQLAEQPVEQNPMAVMGELQ